MMGPRLPWITPPLLPLTPIDPNLPVVEVLWLPLPGATAGIPGSGTPPPVSPLEGSDPVDGRETPLKRPAEDVVGRGTPPNRPPEDDVGRETPRKRPPVDDEGRETPREGDGAPPEDNEGRGTPPEDNEGRGTPPEDSEGRGIPPEDSEGRGTPPEGSGTPPDPPPKDSVGSGTPPDGSETPADVEPTDGRRTPKLLLGLDGVVAVLPLTPDWVSPGKGTPELPP